VTNFSYSNIEFEDNLFKKLELSIMKSQQKISHVADGGINKGQTYKRAIKRFEEELEKGLSENSELSWQEILYITNELVTSKHFFNTLMEYKELETFILLIKKYKKLSIYKKLFNIYFIYYNTLSEANSMTVLKMYLKSILRSYSGKNRYINNLLIVKEHLFGKLSDLLEHYANDFEAIKIDMKLQDNFEFSKALLNLKIIQELKTLKYDEENQNVFSTIIERKEMFFDDGLSLKEYVAKYLISIAIDEKLPFPNWQIFILRLIGDPRSTAMHSSTMRSWDIIGEDKKNYFIKTLSKDDLKLFLEVLSDSVSDTNYHYRKAFWMQFLEYVVFTKIIIGKDAFITINDTLKEKFQLKNDSYSKLTGNPSQSAIYIDFGKIKIIEYTHNGSVRFYSKCPIDLHQKEYSTSSMTSKINPYLIKALPHSGAKTYNWQKNALNTMNKELDTKISEEDIKIPEDKNKINSYLNSINEQSSKNKRSQLNAINQQSNKTLKKSKIQYKSCSVCKQTLPVGMFNNSNGYTNKCIICSNNL
jgi:hypothetical protein